VNTPTAPRLSAELQVDRARFKVGGGAPPQPVGRVFLTRGFLDGPDQGPRIPFQVVDADASGLDTDGCRIKKLYLQVLNRLSTKGRVDLEDAGLTVASGGIATVAGPVDADTCAIEIFMDGKLQSTETITVTNSSVTAHGGSGATPPGEVTLEGPATILNSTLTAKSGSNGGAGGSITISNLEEARDTTTVAEAGSTATLTLPNDSGNRQGEGAEGPQQLEGG
jgi:hypothetical protein